MERYKRRVAAVQGYMKEQQVDCLLLAPSANLYYFTGLDAFPDERLQLILIPQEGELSLIMPEMYREMIARRGESWKLYTWKDGEDPAALAAKALGGVKKAAVDETMWARHLMAVLPALGEAQLVSASQVVLECRVRKDEEELRLLRASGALADKAAREILPHLREGVTEKEIAFRLERIMREGGAQGLAFTAMAGFGPGGADPHHASGDAELKKGQFVVMDFGAKLDHYCSDITRTVCYGRATDEMKNVYAAVLAANRAGFAAVKPGAACQDVDRAARGVIAGAGFGAYFVHRTGHGLGLDDHEEAYIVEGNARPLEKGMVFSIEPGIYLPDRFGVRIEDIVAVTEDGAESMNAAPRELIELPA